MFEFFVADAHY